MQKGFNSDVQVNGILFHVQTEDWGYNNPYIVTQVFKRGAVVKNIKTPYKEISRTVSSNNERVIRLAMQEQHQKILDHLLSGQMHDLIIK